METASFCKKTSEQAMDFAKDIVDSRFLLIIMISDE
jgi:hypothetical protein